MTGYKRDSTKMLWEAGQSGQCKHTFEVGTSSTYLFNDLSRSPDRIKFKIYLTRIIHGYSKWLSGFYQLVTHNTLEIRVNVFFFLFNRTTLQVFVTYLIGALYVHPLWLYRHQHDNRVRSKLSVACEPSVGVTIFVFIPYILFLTNNMKQQQNQSICWCLILRDSSRSSTSSTSNWMQLGDMPQQFVSLKGNLNSFTTNNVFLLSDLNDIICKKPGLKSPENILPVSNRK